MAAVAAEEEAIAEALAAADATIPDLLVRQRDSARRFVGELEGVFALRDELKNLAEASTTVCRCEDVSHGELADLPSWREAKLQTRCGMGPCQGRICGPSTEFLFGWRHGSIRPPILPTTVSALGSKSVAVCAPSPEPKKVGEPKPTDFGSERPAPIPFPNKKDNDSAKGDDDGTDG